VLRILDEHLAKNLRPAGGDRQKGSRRAERVRASVIADTGMRWTRAALPAFNSCTALRIPAKPGHHSDASEAVIPVHAGPVLKRSVNCGRC
jgi:hypothetical protein